jgi:hypothetical protein
MANESALELDNRPSYLAAGIVSLAVLILYILTLAPNTAMWDTSEYIAAAYTLGLPHPPGNPFFVLIGRVFSILPIAGSIAARVNILAAVASAVSAGMWFLITERVLVGWFTERWQRVAGGTLAAVIGATSFTVWNQSVVNEKVYTVSLVGIAIISWLMIRWSDDPDGPKADRLLVLVGYLLALGYANHMAGALPALAAGVAILVRRPRLALRGIEFFGLLLLVGIVAKFSIVGAIGLLLAGIVVAVMVLGSGGAWRRYALMTAVLGGLVVGMTPFATQPIRAAHYPAINEGEPTGCKNGIAVSCTFSKETWDSFMYNFNRGQYGKPDLSERQAPFSGQIAMYWYYFKWQWLRDAHNDRPFLQSALAALFLVLGLFGGWVHFQRDRRSFWYFGTFMFSCTLLLIYYLNFKYGATQPAGPEVTLDQREVRDRDYFFLWSFSAWGVWAALGLVFIWESIASFFGTETTRIAGDEVTLPVSRGWKAASPILALALIPLLANWTTAPRKGQTDTRDFAADLLNSVEPYGVLVTVGDNDTFPLWYAQEVEHIRQDVVVINTSLANTDWYARQVARRPVYEYDAAKGPAIYRNKTWVKPTHGPLNKNVFQADSIPPIVALQQKMSFVKDSLSLVIDPRQTPIEGYLQRADLLVLMMIQDSWPQRPFYFSRTSGSYAQQLGMINQTLAQGLAAKLFVPPKAASRDTLYVPEQQEWLDVPRTKALWDSVFQGPKALIRRGDWIDQPSVGIPYLYIATGATLASVLNDHGQAAEAAKVFNTTREVARAVRIQTSTELPPPMAVPAETGKALTPGDSRASRQLPVAKKKR